MHRARSIFRLIAAALMLLSLHYVLPQHDVVQVTQVDTRRTDFGGFNRWFYAQADSGSVELANRDILYIFADKKKTALLGFIQRDAMEPMVYRNEDTGWIWPPYFKFDSFLVRLSECGRYRTGRRPEPTDHSLVQYYFLWLPAIRVWNGACHVAAVPRTLCRSVVR